MPIRQQLSEALSLFVWGAPFAVLVFQFGDWWAL